MNKVLDTVCDKEFLLGLAIYAGIMYITSKALQGIWFVVKYAFGMIF